MATIKKHQTLVDFAVANLGDASRVPELMLLNGIGATDELTAGNELATPVADADKKKVLSGFSSRNIVPASYDPVAENLVPKGIGAMTIGQNLKVY